MSKQLAKQILPRELPADIADARLRWKQRNFGILAKIARETGFSKTHVTQIYQGVRSNEFVERALAKAGAPGFDSPEAA